MKKLLAGLFVFGFLFAGIGQVHASVLSDALLKIENLQKELSSLKASLKGSSYYYDIPETPITSIIISGTAKAGQTLRAVVSPSGANATYSWLRKNSYGYTSEIPNATSSSYTILNSDAGSTIFVVAKGTNGYTGGEDGSIRDSVSVSVENSKIVPTVNYLRYQNVTSNSAVLSATVTDSGSPSTITERGICYYQGIISTSQGQGANSTCVDSANNQITINATNLMPETKYSYRAYATNSTGTGYSEVGTFTTLGSTKPQCSDGIDNDNDGLIDTSDGMCHLDSDMLKAYVPTHNSEKIFPINSSSPSLKVLYPQGGEIFKSEDKITVKWESKNVIARDVGILLFDSNNQIKLNVYSTLNDGVETVTLPQVSGTNFKIMISNDQTGGAYSIPFTIQSTINSCPTNVQYVSCPSYQTEAVKDANGCIVAYKCGNQVDTPDSSVDGCASGAIFNTKTGKFCSMSTLNNLDVGYKNNDLYNTNTNPYTNTNLYTNPYTNANLYTNPYTNANVYANTNNSAITRTLKQGTKGDDVKILQEFLGLDADGVFGRGTASAVKKWQQENGLKADGLFGKIGRTKAGLE